MTPTRATFLIALAFAGAPVPAAERWSGDAYSSATDALLYHETHYVYDGGRERVVLYRCPDGQPFARKHVQETANAQAPDFDLVDAHLGYREGVRERNGAREVYVQRRPSMPEQASVVPVPANGVIDTGLEAFAQRHWDELLRGKTLSVPYLVPSRRKFFDVAVDRVADAPGTRPSTMTLRLAIDSWLSFLLPHIEIVYDIASRAIVRYEGLSSIRDDNGKSYRIRALYPPATAAVPVDDDEVRSALAAPLASACTAADTRVSARGQATVPEVTPALATRNRKP